MYDLIVIGAGPGGLIAAAECAAAGLRVAVLEKNDQPGKKLLATGSGQCNLTHDLPLEQFSENYHEKTRYVRKVLYQFQPETLCNYFEDLGVVLEVTRQGKVFPKSRKASEILEALLKRLNAHGGAVIGKAAVTALRREADHFVAETAGGPYTARRVLLATGGRSYPALGTSGDGYGLAEALGHHVVPVRPALASVKTVETSLADLAGISIQQAWVSQWRQNRKLKEYVGDLLFTHEGLSGPVILNNSREFMAGDVLRINLARAADEMSFTRGMGEHLNAYGKYTARKALDYYDIPRRVMERLLELSGIPLEMKCAEMTRAHRSALLKGLIALPLTLKEVGGYENAMVTAGGVATEEVRPGTMESRLVPGLHFAGEVLDVDGETGGFNLQFAFSSGFAAAQAVIAALAS